MVAPSGGEAATGAAYTQFLAQLPFLAGVPADDLATFAATVLTRNLPAGTDVVIQRQYGHSMFVVLSGQLAVHVIGAENESLQLGKFEKTGDYFGEAALLGRGERTATVTTLSDCTLLEIEKHRFDLLSRRYKSVRDHLEGTYHARAISTYMRTHRYLGMLDNTTRDELARGSQLKLFQRGDSVAKTGDRADSVLVIKDGVVKASRKTAQGGVSILAYFNTHDVVGNNDGTTRDYELDALGNCEVLYLPRAQFTMAMAKFPEVNAHFTKDDMQRRQAIGSVGQTVFGAAQAFLQAGVEVESLLVINLDRCVRCGNCVRACHARHKYTRLDRRGPIFRRRAKAQQVGHHEHVMLPTSCRHCRDPECMIGCPTGAIQREASGDVDINDNCIGCENCARKCPYGNITMRPLDEKERPSPEVTKRAIKCNLCRGHSYSNCVHECPRGAILRVDPLRYFEELALVMEAEQRDAIEWSRGQAKQMGMLGTKQEIRPRSTWFIPVSIALGILAICSIIAGVIVSSQPLRGGSHLGLPLGIGAATCLLLAASLGVRKRLRDNGLGKLEAWTQFHMMLGGVGFTAALAHAGFQVTGVFTTLLILVFALEVASGVWGQWIYMTVPKMLTRLERHGLARLVEDLVTEESTLETSINELVATLPVKLRRSAKNRIEAIAGSLGTRLRATYDPPAALTEAKTQMADVLARTEGLTDELRGTLDRILESRCRLIDVRTQLHLHRRLRRWVVLHVATASALLVLLAFHIITAMTLV
jgi:Fe-S-cluster-containing dehydrogenase component/CRP-like cAMP-binding protein